MKNPSLFYLSVLIPLLFFSCQAKYVREGLRDATGSLQNDANGDCLPKTIAGTYNAGKELGDTNHLFITVDVQTTGNYDIKTNEVNGYSFSTSGTFTNIGLKQIRLVAKGKPLTAENDEFTVSFGSSVCRFKIPVDGVGATAVFSFTGSPSSCINADVEGGYTKTVPLDASNKVTLGVNVSAVGSYTVTTNTVNGYKFSGSGTFTKTGLQKIVLPGSGQPLASGTDNLTVAAGSSFCSFPVTVQ
jgi:hypothetical protein